MTTAAASRNGCSSPTWPGSRPSGCAPGSCGPGCPRSGSPSAWPPSSPSSACPPPPRPACSTRSTSSAPTCSTVSNGQSLTGGTAELPTTAPAMIGRIGGVQQVQSTGAVSGANAYRNPYIPSVDTNALTVQAASLDLLPVVATSVAQGHYLNAATAQEPVAVLGAAAAQRLGIDRIYPGERIWVGGQWFYVAGILNPAVLAPAIDSSVLVGYPAAEKYLGFDGHPSTIYLRAQNDQVNARRQPPGRHRQPREPQRGQRQPTLLRPGRPSRRQERPQRPLPRPRRRRPPRRRGRRRQHHDHLGPRTPLRDRPAPRPRRHQRPHPHPVPLRSRPARTPRRRRRRRPRRRSDRRLRPHQNWATVIPTEAWAGGIAASLIIGAVAGLIPALRAARLSPTQALWSI